MNALRASQSTEPNLEYVNSAAFHESGHIVIAAVQDLPLQYKGIGLDRWGRGIAYYRDRKPNGSRNVGSETEREKTIIATYAGWFAQNKFRRCPQSGAYYDINQANDLLDEMYPSRSTNWETAKESLAKVSERLVDLHWGAIESVALALWSKPESPRTPEPNDWSGEPFEKCLRATEISEILRQFGITTKIESER